MSNIEPNIIDPAKGPPIPPPDSNPDLPGAPGDIREPGSDTPPIEPDPEERGGRLPDDIERA